MIQPYLRSDFTNIRFLFNITLDKSIISFKGKDLWTFSDGNNQIFLVSCCPSSLVGHYI